MTSKQKSQLLVIGVALTLFTSGCGGLNASRSISPLDFLLPGSGLFHLQNTPPPPLLNTNDIVAVNQPVILTASVR